MSMCVYMHVHACACVPARVHVQCKKVQLCTNYFSHHKSMQAVAKLPTIFMEEMPITLIMDDE